MFSSIGWGEIMVLLVVALFIFGPDRLPSIARDASGAMRKVRTFVSGAREQIREEFGDEFADLDLGSLNPREFVRRQLLDDDPPSLIKRSNGARAAMGSGKPVTRMATGATRGAEAGTPNLSKPALPLRAVGESPPYDPDAT